MGSLVRNQSPDKIDIGSGVGWSVPNLSLCPWVSGRFEKGNQWGKLQVDGMVFYIDLLPGGRTISFQQTFIFGGGMEPAETLIFHWQVPSRNDKPHLRMGFSAKAAGSWVFGDCSGYWDLCR